MIYPFQGVKNLYHVPYWSRMEGGEIPPPVLVTLDPINQCNLRCVWCNGCPQMNRSGGKYSDRVIDDLPSFLVDWGVKAVCVAGGGESLLHDGCSRLIDGLAFKDIQIGVVTNGVFIDRHISAIGKCKWVGISVDAGDSNTYWKLKGADCFSRVLRNIEALRDKWPDLEITYKYLIHADNIHSIFEAAGIAKKLCCNYFHARPAGREWMDIRENHPGPLFAEKDVVLALKILEAAKEMYEDDHFKVRTVTEKFSSDNWDIKHNFSTCRALGMTCVIQPDNTVSLCCDRRGDERVELCRWSRLSDISKAWGSKKHWQIIERVNLADCPRCTYAPHNRLYEEFTSKRDQVCKWFI